MRQIKHSLFRKIEAYNKAAFTLTPQRFSKNNNLIKNIIFAGTIQKECQQI